jgi:hypothetical protein
LSGLLNVKNIKQKNVELRTKIEYWDETIDERKRQAKTLIDRENQVTEALTRYSNDFSVEKDSVLQILHHFKHSFAS